MTKDLAILIGPEQSWMTTEQFFEAIRDNLEAAMAADGSARLTRPASGERICSRRTPKPIRRGRNPPKQREAVEQAQRRMAASPERPRSDEQAAR